MKGTEDNKVFMEEIESLRNEMEALKNRIKKLEEPNTNNSFYEELNVLDERITMIENFLSRRRNPFYRRK